MKSWIDTTWNLEATDCLMVTSHKDTVSLHQPGYLRDGHGFSLNFVPAHLPVLRELLTALEALGDGPQHPDVDALQQRYNALFDAGDFRTAANVYAELLAAQVREKSAPMAVSTQETLP